MIIRRGEVGTVVPFEIVCDAEAEFADDGGRVAAAVVVAGEIEVGGGGIAGAGIVDAVVVGVFDVAVVVVGGEIVVREVLMWVAGAPFRVLRFRYISQRYRLKRRYVGHHHHLNVQAIVGADVESSFFSPNARPRCRVISLPHRIGLAVATLDRLVDYLQHSHIPVIVVGMDDICHPLEKLVSAFVLVIDVETSRGGDLKRSVTNRHYFPLHIPVQYPDYWQPEPPAHHANQ